ncbi:Polyol transporter 5 [Linum perenne]
MMNTIRQIKTRSPLPYSGTILLAIFVSVPFCLHGYDVAVTRAMDVIAEDLSLTVDQIDMYLMTMGRWPVAGGALVAGVAANFTGRKYPGAIVYIIGVLIMTFAHSYRVSVVGRALSGFGTGMGLLVGPIYIAEIAPASVRSFLGHFPQVILAIGMMSAYMLELAFTRLHPHTSWRLIIGLSALPALAFTASLYFLPDTPCWLVMTGKVDIAKQLLEDCRARKEDSDDDEEEEEVDEVEIRMMQLKKAAGLDLYCTGNNVKGAPQRIIGARALLEDMFTGDPIFRPMFRATFLLIVQEVVFEDIIFRNLPPVLERNGFKCCISSAAAGAVLSCIKLLSTMLSSIWANGPGGRKALLLLSIFLAGCSLGAFGTTILAEAHDRLNHGTAFAFYSAEIVVLQAVIGFGIGPYPWMYGPEAFPLAVRAPCLALCIVAKYALRFVFNLCIPVLYAPFKGMWVAFLVASGVQAVSLVLCWFFIRDFTSQILVDHVD